MSSAIAIQARSLTVELDIDNSSGEPLPGSFMQARFKLAPSGLGLRLPPSALIFDAKGLHVAVLGPEDRVVIKDVVMGRDFGTEFEVVAGILPTDEVILNPPTTLAAGDRVQRAPEAAQRAGK